LNAIRFVLALPIAALLLAMPALAQSSGQSPLPTQGTPLETSNADKSMMAGMSKMNHAMSAAPLTGNADQDFVAMMLPHHQGAVSMAQVELKYGQDLEMRRLAKSIIAAQDKEIAEMRAWQQRHPKP
jgi:uncharacterized protein (DUF305 family)